ncbi:MAG TPA: hypothetical protein VET24_16705 [Actinomycetota bacterium]|nr:hypothetical protein [Actinomycetota bacterium]
MIRAFRSEWVKLRRRTLILSTYLSLTAVSGLFTVLVFSRASNATNGRGDNFISLQAYAALAAAVGAVLFARRDVTA